MKKIGYILLILIFLFTLSARLFFSFSVPNYSSDEAYFNIRQIEYIQQTSKPLYDDSLSFSGRSFVFPPIFGYSLAFIGLVFPINFTAKFFPNLFAASLVFFTYLIARRISKNSNIALLTAFISSFVPIFFQQTFNNISVYSLVMPLFFLLLYSFMNLKKKKWAYCYIVSIILLTTIHPSVILFIIGLWFYLLLMRVEGLEMDKAEIEMIIFSTFFVFLSLFIMFKKIFLFHGPSVIWQNIPKEILSNYFSQISVLQVVYLIGIIPALCGVYLIYRYIFKEKQQEIYLLIGFIFSVALLLWLRLIQIKIGLMFFGVIIVLLFAKFCRLFLDYIKNTKASKFSLYFGILLTILFVITSVVPSFALAKTTLQTSVTNSEIEALQWLGKNTPEGSVVLGTVHEGNLITAIAERKNVVDSNFIFIKDAEQRLEDVGRIFTTFSMTEAIDLLNKYGVNYIYFSPKARMQYGKELSYIDESCFSKVYENGVIIYKSLCKMELIK